MARFKLLSAAGLRRRVVAALGNVVAKFTELVGADPQSTDEVTDAAGDSLDMQSMVRYLEVAKNLAGTDPEDDTEVDGPDGVSLEVKSALRNATLAQAARVGAEAAEEGAATSLLAALATLAGMDIETDLTPVPTGPWFIYLNVDEGYYQFYENVAGVATARSRAIYDDLSNVRLKETAGAGIDFTNDPTFDTSGGTGLLTAVNIAWTHGGTGTVTGTVGASTYTLVITESTTGKTLTATYTLNASAGYYRRTGIVIS